MDDLKSTDIFNDKKEEVEYSMTLLPTNRSEYQKYIIKPYVNLLFDRKASELLSKYIKACEAMRDAVYMDEISNDEKDMIIQYSSHIIGKTYVDMIYGYAKSYIENSGLEAMMLLHSIYEDVVVNRKNIKITVGFDPERYMRKDVSNEQ